MVETALPGTLIGFGVAGSVATIAVLSWRFLQYLLPIPIGGIAYVSLRVGKLGQAQREQTNADAERERLPVERRLWDEASGEFKAVDADGSPAANTEGDDPPATTPDDAIVAQLDAAATDNDDPPPTPGD